MENAAAAVSKLFTKGSAPSESEGENVGDSPASPSATGTPSATTSTGQDVDTTVKSEVAPAVEHTHVRKEHETREQKFVEKERHQDHYHTTIQPLKDSEVQDEEHDHVQETKHRVINKDDNTAKAKAETDVAGLESTEDQREFESKTKEPTVTDEHVHHHLHETVQPVIEKEVVVPSVTHKRIDVKEKIKDPSKHHEVTTNSAISVEEFEKKLGGKTESSAVVDDKVL